jgi:hypothetical protein
MSAYWSEMRYLRGKDFIPDTNNPTRTWLETYIHADDREPVFAAINAAIRTKSPFEFEHPVIRLDGTLGWTHSRAIPVFGADDEILEWFGAARYQRAQAARGNAAAAGERTQSSRQACCRSGHLQQTLRRAKDAVEFAASPASFGHAPVLTKPFTEDGRRLVRPVQPGLRLQKDCTPGN